MRFTTKSRCALTVMIYIGLRENHGPVNLVMLGKKLEISVSYLEQIFKKLRSEKLVNSTKGPGGGYTLSKSAADISLADIILAVEETTEDDCNNYVKLTTETFWSELNKHVIDFLKSITLQKLIDEQANKGLVNEIDSNVGGRSAKTGIFKLPTVETYNLRTPNSVFTLGFL